MLNTNSFFSSEKWDALKLFSRVEPATRSRDSSDNLTWLNAPGESAIFKRASHNYMFQLFPLLNDS